MPPKPPCHCAHPQCPSCRGRCQSTDVKPVSISYLGERKGEFRLCEPCTKGWKTLDGMDIEPI